MEHFFSLIIGSDIAQRIFLNRSRPWFLTFLIGCLVSLLTTSRSPEMLLMESRAASFGSTAQPSALDLASHGFFMGKAGCPVCFHCSAPHHPSAAFGHGSASSSECHLRQLLHFGLGLAQATTSRMQAEMQSLAMNFQRNFNQLKLHLQFNVDIIGFVESFGYSAAEIQLAVASLFLGSGGRNSPQPGWSPKPGELIELINEQRCSIDRKLLAQPILTFLAEETPAESVATGAALPDTVGDRRDARSQAAVKRQEQSQPPRQEANCPGTSGSPSGSTNRPQSLTDAQQPPPQQPVCQQCQRRQCSRVALPCSHFALCGSCADLSSVCPQCCADLSSVCPQCCARILHALQAFTT